MTNGRAIGRNISGGGLLVEMTYAPPIGTVVTVHFQNVRESDGGDIERDWRDVVMADWPRAYLV